MNSPFRMMMIFNYLLQYAVLTTTAVPRFSQGRQ